MKNGFPKGSAFLRVDGRCCPIVPWVSDSVSRVVFGRAYDYCALGPLGCDSGIWLNGWVFWTSVGIEGEGNDFFKWLSFSSGL